MADKTRVIGYGIRHSTEYIPKVAQQLEAIIRYARQHDDLSFDHAEHFVAENVVEKRTERARPKMADRPGIDHIVTSCSPGDHIVFGTMFAFTLATRIPTMIELFDNHGCTMAMADCDFVDSRYKPQLTQQFCDLMRMDEAKIGVKTKLMVAPWGWRWAAIDGAPMQLVPHESERIAAEKIFKAYEELGSWIRVYAYIERNHDQFNVRNRRSKEGKCPVSWSAMIQLWLCYVLNFPKIGLRVLVQYPGLRSVERNTNPEYYRQQFKELQDSGRFVEEPQSPDAYEFEKE